MVDLKQIFTELVESVISPEWSYDVYITSPDMVKFNVWPDKQGSGRLIAIDFEREQVYVGLVGTGTCSYQEFDLAEAGFSEEIKKYIQTLGVF